MIRMTSIVVMVIIAGALTVSAFHTRANTLDRTNHQICVAIQNINRIVTGQLLRSKQNLPRLAYFKAHPSELRDQIASVDRQLAAFRPRHCK